MNHELNKRIVEEANYLISTKQTIREVAKFFKRSKSSIHKDMQERLKFVSPELNGIVKKILDQHKKERHIKGGMATKEKYTKKGDKNESKGICYKYL